jgi:hypothetical protein
MNQIKSLNKQPEISLEPSQSIADWLTGGIFIRKDENVEILNKETISMILD